MGPTLHGASLERPLSASARAVLLAIGILMSGLVMATAANPPPVAAGTCVRFVASNFDAPGTDNAAANLNGEWVRIKNVCATTKYLSGWRIHDYGRKHTYTFPSGFRIGARNTITLYSGTGTNTSSKRYFQRTYGAVWNNAPPEYAYLRKADGTLMSKWTEFASPSPTPTPTPTPTPEPTPTPTPEPTPSATPSFEPTPAPFQYECGTPSEIPITPTTTWTITRSTYCSYYLLRYVDSPSPIMFDDGFLTYWEYVPVTSDSDPVAFESDGLSWTFSQEVVLPIIDPPPCDPEPGYFCLA